jgi:hypothetical protein
MTHFYIADQQEREEIEKRFTFHPAKDDQPERYEKLREEAKKLAMSITQFCPPSRERALALTNLEQAMMWANAGIARNE